MFRKHHPPAGAPPGALVAPAETRPARLFLTDYTAEAVHEREIADLSELSSDPPSGVRWLSVQGAGNLALLTAIGERFHIHPLALADIVNIPQRPKLDPYDDHALLIARTAHLGPARHIVSEQISIVLRERCVISFEEGRSDLLEPVRQRIRHQGPVTHHGAEFLAQAILDTIVDGYYPLLEHLGEELEHLEEEAIHRPTRRILHRIYRIKHALLTIRRSIYPQRDAIQAALRRDHALFTPASTPYFRDTYDHAAQVVDVLESFREVAAGLMDVYLTSISNRAGEVMKVLTVIATIFIPLSFLVGVYGMNFVWMPELRVWWAYPLLWGIMLAVGAVMLVYFKRRGWLEGEERLAVPPSKPDAGRKRAP